MKILKSIMSLSLLTVLMALPQMNYAAPVPQEMNAPQSDIITVSVMGNQFSAETLYPLSLLPITVEVRTADGALLYSTTQTVGSISVPASATSRLIGGDGINAVVGDGFDHLVVGDGIDHLVVGDGIDHLVVGDGFDHLVLTAIQGGTLLISEEFTLD